VPGAVKRGTSLRHLYALDRRERTNKSAFDLGKPEMDAKWKARMAPEELPTRATVGVADLGGDTLIAVVVGVQVTPRS